VSNQTTGEGSTPTPAIIVGPRPLAIVGVTIGALVVVGCIGGGLFWYYKKSKAAAHDLDVWLEKTEQEMRVEDARGDQAGEAPPELQPPTVSLIIKLLTS
jgi:hypothetical protein